PHRILLGLHPSKVLVSMHRSVLRLASGLTAVGVVAAGAVACSKNETAQARGRDAAPKSIKVEVVKEERVTRSVDLVGTLAAVDQVVISTEADGQGRRNLADLGYRVT